MPALTPNPRQRWKAQDNGLRDTASIPVLIKQNKYRKQTARTQGFKNWERWGMSDP